MGVHLYTNGAWTDSGKIYRNSENLYNPNAKDTNNGYIANQYLSYEGYPTTPGSGLVWSTSEYIEINDDERYLSICGLSDTSSGSPSICFYDVNYDYISGTPYQNIVNLHINIPNNSKYFRFSIDGRLSQIMVVFGINTVPFEPYNVVDWYTNTGHGYSSGAWS